MDHCSLDFVWCPREVSPAGTLSWVTFANLERLIAGKDLRHELKAFAQLLRSYYLDLHVQKMKDILEIIVNPESIKPVSVHSIHH